MHLKLVWQSHRSQRSIQGGRALRNAWQRLVGNIRMDAVDITGRLVQPNILVQPCKKQQLHSATSNCLAMPIISAGLMRPVTARASQTFISLLESLSGRSLTKAHVPLRKRCRRFGKQAPSTFPMCEPFHDYGINEICFLSNTQRRIKQDASA